MKQWNGEKLEINFYWTSIFMMGMNKADGLLWFDLNLSDSVLQGHKDAK